MADNLDDFFKKKDRKKKNKGAGFAKANTDVVAKKLEESDIRKTESKAGDDGPLATSEAAKAALEDTAAAVASKAGTGTDTTGRVPTIVGGAETALTTAKSKYFGLPSAALPTAAAAAPTESGTSAETNDDEWKTYDDEKKDYSGLKIESLKLEESGAKADAADDVEHEINAEGEKVPVRKGEEGPWKKVNQPEGSGAPEDEEEAARLHQQKHQQERDAAHDHMTEAVSKMATGGKYIPPSLRGSAGSQTSAPTSRIGMRGRMKQAPDINSTVYFPSLSAASTHDGDDRRSGFEEIRPVHHHGSHPRAVANQPPAGPPKLALDNKFDALRD